MNLFIWIKYFSLYNRNPKIIKKILEKFKLLFNIFRGYPLIDESFKELYKIEYKFI